MAPGSQTSIVAENSIAAIQSAQGVTAMVIFGGETDSEGHFEVHRRHNNMQPEGSQAMSDVFGKLCQLARHVVRDLDASDELMILRIRMMRREVMCCPKYDESTRECKFHVVAEQSLNQ